MEGLLHASAVPHLVEIPANLIPKIIHAVETARQNKLECHHLARRVSIIGELLPPLPQEAGFERPLEELGKTLSEAHKLVLACQNPVLACHKFLLAAGRAERFSEVNARIDSNLAVFPLIINASIASRLDRITPPNRDGESTITVTGPPPCSSFGSLQTQSCQDGESSQHSEGISILLPSSGMTDQVSELNALKGILIDANAEPIGLSYPFISSMTANFSNEIGRGGFGIVYQGDLGTRKVAVKKLSISASFSDKLFVDEIKCLMKAKHNNVVRFLAYCADTHGKLVLFNGQPVISELPQRLLCFEYVPNGNLQKYLEANEDCRVETRYVNFCS